MPLVSVKEGGKNRVMCGVNLPCSFFLILCQVAEVQDSVNSGSLKGGRAQKTFWASGIFLFASLR